MLAGRLTFVSVVLVFLAHPALAQETGAPFDLGCRTQERISESHLRCVGDVEFEQGDMKLYADVVDYFTDENRAVAEGNVVFSQGANSLSADRAEFDTETRLGVFYNASGIANIRPRRQNIGGPGIAVPQMTGQENDVYFFGETVEKIGPKKYRITNGGFTTCVQPTPRWNLNASTVVLNIDAYTLLTQAVLRVKGVPLLYLPFMYYPTNEDNRSTGFLIPTYGTSTIRGQNISNAFFWAINRSHDATVYHDWFSRTGQGVGSEYRYNIGAGDANLRAYLLDEQETTYEASDGSSVVQPAERSYEVRGALNHQLPGNFRARGRVDYFSSLRSSQTFNTNVYDTSRTQRTFGGNVVGAWRTYSLNATYDRSEYFFNETDSTVTGSAPRISINRNERQLFRGSQLYLAVNGEAVSLTRQSRTSTVSYDSGVTRLDFSPQIRYPFKRWQWFTVNSSASWRDTFYTRRVDPNTIDPETGRARILDDGLNRRYFTLQAQAVGPVFNRIWDTPNNGYAERFKHSIEPFVNIRKTSAIDNFTNIIRTDSVDTVVGNATSFTYGISNRIFARRRVGQIAQAQEIVNVELRQSYYSDERSAQFDRDFSTSFSLAPPSHFSPIALSVRATPSASLNGTLRAEIDSEKRKLRTLSASGGYNWNQRLQTSVGWSRRFLIEGLRGFDNPNSLDHSLNVTTNARTTDNRFGGAYSFNYDVLRSAMLQQRLSGFYNAQCCGLAFEYQTYNLSGIGSFGVPVDRRFFLSFTLAGLGNFSPFNGAMGGIPR
jgi:LPS-assembly protein